MNLYKKLCMLFMLVFATAVSYADVQVKGYYKKDGTYVQPHMRHDAKNTKDKNEPTQDADKARKTKEVKKETVDKTEKQSVKKDGDVSVKGYYRKDGTYVKPYQRSGSTSSTNDKATTRATERVEKTKAVTHKATQKNNAQKEGDVSVKGYYKKDGTYVQPYHKTSPNKTDKDNWSTKGNVNPYTGKKGTK